MFDFNGFKKSVKEWIRTNPDGSVNDLRDFCEEQIPPPQYTANEWIVEQTVSWYRHILNHRDVSQENMAEDDID